MRMMTAELAEMHLFADLSRVLRLYQSRMERARLQQLRERVEREDLQRRFLVVQLHDHDGWTFGEIAAAFCVSRQRVHLMYHEEKGLEIDRRVAEVVQIAAPAEADLRQAA